MTSTPYCQNEEVALGSPLWFRHDVTSLRGQRTKVLLALEKPDILLFDEPTNYMDAEHIEWLKRSQNYEMPLF